MKDIPMARKTAEKPALEKVAEGLDRILLRWATDGGKRVLDRHGRPVIDKEGKPVYRELKACDVSVILSRLRQCGITKSSSADEELERLRHSVGGLKLSGDDMPQMDEAS